MSHLRLWLVAARPRTLPAAIAPVIVGTALAVTEDVFEPLRFVAALVGSIFIQIGTNLANDYSDARRGADTEDRLGPVRVTAGGLMPPRRVLVGTWVAFGIAVAAGSYLAAVAGWELLVVGVVSIAAGVLYTGGPRPYGYEGLGELFVFVFFGLVAVGGSYFVQTEDLRWEAVALGVPVGLLAAAILVVNNVRDIETDRRAGKRTLAVRLGRERAVKAFAAMLAFAFISVPVIVVLRRPQRVGAAAAVRHSKGRSAGAHALVAAGRAGPQQAARRHRRPARRILGVARRRPPGFVVKRDLFVLSLPVPRAVRDRDRRHQRALDHASPAGGRRRRRSAGARQRRSSPTTACRSSAWKRCCAAAPARSCARRRRPWRWRCSTSTRAARNARSASRARSPSRST